MVVTVIVRDSMPSSFRQRNIFHFRTGFEFVKHLFSLERKVFVLPETNTYANAKNQHFRTGFSDYF